MKAYSYNRKGYYEREVDVQESPLEPGVFLMPKNTTELPPPALAADQEARFVDGAWQIKISFKKLGEKSPKKALMFKEVEDEVVPRTPKEIKDDEDKFDRIEGYKVRIEELRQKPRLTNEELREILEMRGIL